MLKAIVAIDKNGGIGRNNDLLFKDSEDLGLFKKITEGKTVVMGRRTYESLPMYPKGLPNRKNIVLSKNLKKNSLSEIEDVDASSFISPILKEGLKREVFIIGGGSVYKTFIKASLVQEVIVSRFEIEVEEVDTFFPLKELKQNYTLKETKKYENFTQEIWILNRN